MPPLGPTLPFAGMASSNHDNPTTASSNFVEDDAQDDSEGSHIRGTIVEEDPPETYTNKRQSNPEMTTIRLSLLENSPNLVVLNVGGTEFIENAHLLGCCSLFFELGLQEQEQQDDNPNPKSFDFPHKDPKEWEFVRQLLIPFATEKITLENSRMVLPWLEDLGISRGLTACDEMYLDQVFAKSLCLLDNTLVSHNYSIPKLQHKFTTVLEALETSLQYNLMLSKNSFFSLVRKVFQDRPEIVTILHCSTVGAMVTYSHEGQRELWDTISVYLPEDVKVIDKAMASKAVFGKILYTGIQAHLAVQHLSTFERLIFFWWTGWKKRHEPVRGSYRKPGVEMSDESKAEEAHAIEESLRSLSGTRRSTIQDSFTAANMTRSHSMLLSE